MFYRPYKPDDFPRLYAVEERCFQPPFRFTRSYMRRLVSSTDAAIWIATEETELAGFAIVEWSSEAGESAAYVQTVEVDQPHRGKGVGNELMGLLEASASSAGARTIWLHVDQKNLGAIRLYEARGYTMQGREEHFYARNRAALIYAKSLIPAA